MVPESTYGHLLAALTAIWGILLIALPVAVVGSRFTKIYVDEEKKNKIFEKFKKQNEDVRL